jgi:hypothetical protein
MPIVAERRSIAAAFYTCIHPQMLSVFLVFQVDIYLELCFTAVAYKRRNRSCKMSTSTAMPKDRKSGPRANFF